jgi:hypothetical protein
MGTLLRSLLTLPVQQIKLPEVPNNLLRLATHTDDPPSPSRPKTSPGKDLFNSDGSCPLADRSMSSCTGNHCFCSRGNNGLLSIHPELAC